MRREEFVASTLALCGVPIQHRGRNASVGLDCVGVPVAAAAACGAILAEPAPRYGLTPSEDELADGLRHVARRITTDERQAGDLVQMLMGRQARHCGVIVEVGERHDRIVHAFAKKRRVELALVPVEQIKAVWRLRCLDG